MTFAEAFEQLVQQRKIATGRSYLNANELASILSELSENLDYTSVSGATVGVTYSGNIELPDGSRSFMSDMARDFRTRSPNIVEIIDDTPMGRFLTSTALEFENPNSIWKRLKSAMRIIEA